MEEYIERDEFLKRIKPYNTSDKMDKALYNFALNRMIETPTADVIERTEFEEMVNSFKAMVEIKNENLIAMRDKYYTLEKEYAELKVNINKAIEEMYDLARHKVRPISFDQSVAIDMCIDILKRNIEE